MAAATYFSTQLTKIDAGTHQGAGSYAVGDPYRPMFLGTLAFGSTVMAKQEEVAMVRLPIGVIPFQVGILVSESLGSAVYSIGISGTLAKYRALLVQTDLTGWIWHMLETSWDDDPLTAINEVWITNDNTANFPTTTGGSINMAFECLVP